MSQPWGSKLISFGKNAGKSYDDVIKTDPSWVKWATAQQSVSGGMLDFVNYYKSSSPPLQSGCVSPFESLIFDDDEIYVTPSSELKSSSYVTPTTSFLTPTDPAITELLVLQLVSRTHFAIFVNGKRPNQLTSFLPPHIYSAVCTYRDRNCVISDVSTVFHADSYPIVCETIQGKAAKIELIPNFVLLSFDAFRVHLGKSLPVARTTANILMGVVSPRTRSLEPSIQSLMGDSLIEALKPFQIEGVRFGMSRNGRCLIADEMGLGKTLQALALAAIFKDDWPCLIICPSSIRFQWRDQINNWLNHLVKPSEVKVVKSGKDFVDSKSLKILICSYDLIKNEKYQLNYNFIIVDESHYIKNLSSQRSATLIPLLQNSNRAILLSGTPALNKPTELFAQLAALIPTFATLHEFSNRYSQSKVNPWSKKKEFSGYRLNEELHCVLSSTVMIRRLKRLVQTQLPPKIRSKIPVEMSSKELAESTKLLAENKMTLTSGSASASSIFQCFGVEKEKEPKEDIKNVVGKLFQLSGRGKVCAAAEHLIYLVESGVKLLGFAHHIEVLDGIEEKIKAKKIKYVRIDGSTTNNAREENVKKFQSDENVMIGLFSITACSHGLNLTAASTVVFCELYWVPGVVVQAEDRSHRLGTTHSNINIHYLIAEGSIDEMMYRILQKKWFDATGALDGCSEDLMARKVSPTPPVLHKKRLGSNDARSSSENKRSKVSQEEEWGENGL